MFLRRLVTTLTATMIVGVAVIVVLMVLRLQTPAVAPFPDDLALPAGTTLQALTRGPDYLLAITTDGRAFVLSPDGATVHNELSLRP